MDDDEIINEMEQHFSNATREELMSELDHIDTYLRDLAVMALEINATDESLRLGTECHQRLRHAKKILDRHPEWDDEVKNRMREITQRVLTDVFSVNPE
jgi:hypothetical protein